MSICIHTYKETTTPYIRIDTFLYLNKTPPLTHSTMEPWKYAHNNALYTQLCLHIFTQHRLIHTTQRILIRTQRCRMHTMTTFTFAHNAALYTHKRPRFTHTHTQRRLRHITTPFTLTHNTALYTPQWRIIQKYNIIHITMPFTFTHNSDAFNFKDGKRLTHNNVLYTHQCLSQLHPTPLYRRKTNLPYTHKDPSYIVVVGVVVVNVDALEQANDFRIERRQVAFYAKWTIRILEVRNNESPANWMPTHKPIEL